VLVDESKQADIENLGDCLRAWLTVNHLGFLLTIVLYGVQNALEQLGPSSPALHQRDGNLFAETYNQLNAYFATVRAIMRLNLRKLYLLNTNYADLSFLFTILPGEKTNAHLGTEYLAVLETDNSTPYYLNLHTGDVAHTLILGMSGSANSGALRFLGLIQFHSDLLKSVTVEQMKPRVGLDLREDSKHLAQSNPSEHFLNRAFVSSGCRP